MAEEQQPPGAGQQPPGAGQPGAGGAPQDPAAAQQEEELRRRLEEELRRLRVEDVLLQSVVSLINLTSRRIAKPDEQDLDQARLGIDAIRALVGLLPDEAADQVRQALSELQVAYASEAGGGAGAPGGEQAAEGAEPPKEPPKGPQKGAAEGQRPSGLWTPHDRDS